MCGCGGVPKSAPAIFVEKFVHLGRVELGAYPLDASVLSGPEGVRAHSHHHGYRRVVEEGVGCFPPSESHFTIYQGAVLKLLKFSKPGVFSMGCVVLCAAHVHTVWM